MHEENIIINTKDGNLDSRLFISDKNSPNIIFYMDAPAIREELRDMCRRIASHGYNVILPNLFYRLGVEQKYPFNQKTYKSNKEQLRKMISTMHKTTNNMVISDTKYILEYISNNFIKSSEIGIVGYCMSGRFVVACGAKYSHKIKAIASFYGVDIITNKTDSPHLLANKIRGEIYLAFAEKDVWVPGEILKKIKEKFSKIPAKCTIEIYKGTDHGFAFPNRNTYSKEAATKHWLKLLNLFDRNLK